MRVLLDACVPRLLRKFLAGHFVRTAQEMGWGQLKNGALLREAEIQFEAFISVASARVRERLKLPVVSFAPEYGSEDKHQIGRRLCRRRGAGATGSGRLACGV